MSRPWVGILAGLALAAILSRQARAGTMDGRRRITWPGALPTDAEYLARVMMYEGSSGTPEEWLGVMWCAINRARKAGRSVRAIVATTAWPGGGARGRDFAAGVQLPAGRRSPGYLDDEGNLKTRRSPLDYGRYEEALGFARAILSGSPLHANPIGQRTHFVSPQSLPSCSTPGAEVDGRPCYDWRPRFGAWGPRRTPEWAIARADGGTAEFDPIRLGRSVFT